MRGICLLGQKVAKSPLVQKPWGWIQWVITNPWLLGLFVATGFVLDKYPYFYTSHHLVPNAETFVKNGDERIAFRYCNRLNETRGMWRREREDLYVNFYFELKATKDPDTGLFHPGAEILMKWLLPKLPDNPDSLAA